MKNFFRVLVVLPWLLMNLWAGAPHDHKLRPLASAPVSTYGEGKSASASANAPIVSFAFLEADHACALCEWLAVAMACALGVAFICGLRREWQRFFARQSRVVFRVVSRCSSRAPPDVVFV